MVKKNKSYEYLRSPNKNKNKWYNQDLFLDRLDSIEKYARRKNKFYNHNNINCTVCKEKMIGTGFFKINNLKWDESLFHYIEKHNYKPSDNFINFIFRFRIPDTMNQKKFEIHGINFSKGEIIFVKLEPNQIMIMDALFEHGSRTKKYIDQNDKNIRRYSEHAGTLDFNYNGLDKIIISAQTDRVDKNDSSIFMPQNFIEAYDYEYIFHTHPSTPSPGGRANQGILYEFPSISDIFHFIDHFNKGIVQGSLVLTPEGLYNIRKMDLKKNRIKIDEDAFYRKIRKNYWKIQDEAIDFYTTNFSKNDFYTKIAQDTTYIDKLNILMNEFKMHIDYFPRTRDKSQSWIIDTVYLPVYIIEPQI